MEGIRGEGERERSRIEKVRIVEKKKAEAGEMELEAKDKIDNTPSGEFAELILKGLIDPIYFFDGAETNFKITTLDDIEIFKALLAAKKASWQK